MSLFGLGCFIAIWVQPYRWVFGKDFCEKGDDSCDSTADLTRYSEDYEAWSRETLRKIAEAEENYVTSCKENLTCSCYMNVLSDSLRTWTKEGISQELIRRSKSFGVVYQIIDGKLYRQKETMFPFSFSGKYIYLGPYSRCSGIEHFILKVMKDVPYNLEFVVNTRDYPQATYEKLPVFSFSKDQNHYDIMYPAWSFWEGGPAISLHPTGIGRWDLLRESISAAGERIPWDKKEGKGFFRGSRTSSERDPLVLFSRTKPEHLDAQFTKNQAWKSKDDTLGEEPAQEASFEEHCKFKYLFNFRGVAASFRFKHLFLCKSLVFHVGSEWLEFFYPAMKPWIHFVPVEVPLNFTTIERLLRFARENDKVAEKIARRGFDFIWHHLRMMDIECYWRRLLRRYAKLLTYEPVRDESFIEIGKKV